MRVHLLLAIVVAAGLFSPVVRSQPPSSAAPAPQIIRLWSGQAPGAQGELDEDTPEDRQTLLVRADGFGRILVTPVQRLVDARKDRTALARLVAAGDDIVEVLAAELVVPEHGPQGLERGGLRWGCRHVGHVPIVPDASACAVLAARPGWAPTPPSRTFTAIRTVEPGREGGARTHDPRIMSPLL